MRKKLLFFIALFSFVFGFAQKESNIWYFYNGGLNFSTQPPTLLSRLDSKLRNNLCAITMADSVGNLIFYSNGDTVWNKAHNIMQNGIGIGGNNALYGFSNLSVRLPLSKKLYYVFTCDGSLSYQNNDGVCYSIIDIETNLGQGRVLSKKNLLVKNSASKVAAVLHANQRDIWIAIKQHYSDTLFVFLLTPSGLSPSVIKHNTYKDSGWIGQMKFSPDGRHLVLANTKAESYLYSFNTATGGISNLRKINTQKYSTYGIEFSPNSKYLYFTYYNKGVWFTQCPLKSITASFTPDSNTYSVKLSTAAFHLQLGPNQKLYMAISDTFLAMVNFPNRFGSACFFEPKGQRINVHKQIPVSYPTRLPGFLASHFRSSSFEINKNCISDPVIFTITDSTDVDSVHWDFGDVASGIANFSSKRPQVTHKYTSYGNYFAKLVTFSGKENDTFNITVIFQDPKVNFTASDVCENDSVRFINLTPGKNFKSDWKFGDGNGSTIHSPLHFYHINNISKSFNVTLKVTLENQCIDSFIRQVNVNANPSSDFSFTSNQNSTDFKATQSGLTLYKWYFGNGDSSSTKEVTYSYPKSGKYIACLMVMNAANCLSKTCKEVSVAVGISNRIKPHEFKIYPNPNFGHFIIEKSETKEILTIEIFNQIGQIVHKSELNEYMNAIELNLPNGVYLIRVTNGESSLNQRMIVTK